MLLKDVRITDYRSVEDSGVVPLEDDVTCLVGKNESGKTAFMQALHLLNPLNPIKGKKTYDEVMDYPSRKSSAYKEGPGERPGDRGDGALRAGGARGGCRAQGPRA